MTVEAWNITPPYTISGTGPYAIEHPYVEGAIRVYIRLATGLLALNPTEYTVSPAKSDTTGNLTLSPTLATTYAGRPLIIDRNTPDEQGWLGVLGEREAGLEAQLDRLTQSIQELRARGAGALRVRTELEAFDWAEGTVPILVGGKPVSGPTADAIAQAQIRATEAATSASAAATSAAAALAKENSMLRDRGAWATGVLYSPSDIFTGTAASAGTSYITQVAHTSTTIAADLAAGRIRIFAAKGDAGAGTGDMLKTENLSGLTNYPLARATLGITAAGDLLATLTASSTHVAGTNAQGQAPIAATARLAFIDSVAVLSGVTLPTIASGQNGADMIVVLNAASTAAVNVYPAAGQGFEGLALNAPILLRPGWRLHLVRRFTTQWAYTLLPRDVAAYVDPQLFGIGQTWQDLTASRFGGVSYQNTTGKPIYVSMRVNNGSVRTIQVSPDGFATTVTVGTYISTPESFSFPVPPGWFYRIDGPSGITFWSELR